MKVYTKILIGMVVGAVVGVFLGPKSEFLSKDLYRIDRADQVTLLSDPDQPKTEVPLPPKVKLRLSILQTRTRSIENKKGEQIEVPDRVQVSFKYTRQMALLDKTGELKRLLGAKKVGQRVKAWLVVEHEEIESGEIVSFPQPVSSLGDTVVSWLSPIGELFMRLITMVIVPLVFSSLLVGVAGLGDVRKLGRLGGKTLLLYVGTTAVAVTIGLTCAHVIRPGSFVAEKDQAALKAQFSGDAESQVEKAAEAPSAIDNILAIIPENPVDSMTQGKMLQIIFFALIFGVALTLLKEERSRQVVSFFDTIQHAMIVIIHMVMAVAPFGVAALLAEVVGNSGVSILKSLLVYGFTVLVGLLLQAALVYGGLVRFFAKLKLVQFLKAARPAQLIAFSTSSSSATLPITMECAEQSLGVSNSVASFVIPLGSTVNMDGTALYQGVAAVFIAQVFNMGLSIGAQAGIVFAATAASIGAAGVPGAGMITLAMVLTTAGIPTAGVALILGMDRILDMCRTAVNVTGDLAVTTVMAVSEGEKLRPLSSKEDAQSPDRGFEGRLHLEEHKVAPDPDADSDGDGEGEGETD